MSPLTLRIVIADDELLARRRLARLLGELPAVELVGECSSGQELLTLIARGDTDVDLVLLDIHMPGLSGLETGTLLPEDGLGGVRLGTRCTLHRPTGGPPAP